VWVQTTLVADKVKEVSEQLVKAASLDPEQAKDVVDDLMQTLKSEQGNFETVVQRQIRNIMQDVGVPRQSEVDELRGRIDRWNGSFETWKTSFGVSRRG
jgi:polyhydroxyalkanoate synthesis regulator phasin